MHDRNGMLRAGIHIYKCVDSRLKRRTGVKMKTRNWIVALVGLLTLSAGSALAAGVGDLQPLVPFAFTAGNQTLPAGEYTVTRSSVFPGVLSIRSRQGAVFVLSPAQESGQADAPRLVFTRYRDRYFLREVWFAGRAGFKLPETREERESSERSSRTAEKPEVVSIRASR